MRASKRPVAGTVTQNDDVKVLPTGVSQRPRDILDMSKPEDRQKLHKRMRPGDSTPPLTSPLLIRNFSKESLRETGFLGLVPLLRSMPAVRPLHWV